ncbi:MAG TPA: roadblock/LC7 domain-containing protein [Verrucomicrobiae bacterium]|jgi:predicted regulator of Ras-like GTPase activity (Roadblock/LC7/MglB family)|nr:roadblock/LC7 domain-containing protein [Verrucomicrobiae bacterium]
MAGLPQLIDEDIQCLDGALGDLLERSEATAALIIDKGGPLICQRGDLERYDTTTIAALAAGSFCATQAIAERCGEINFSSIYQQGDHTSILCRNIDDNLLLIVLFRAALSVGAIKYYGDSAADLIATQLQKAQQRDPGQTVDLVSMNVLDAADVFRKGT